MEDKQIVELYWARSEQAITETDQKYGKYCYYIAHNILKNHEDSEECVNETYWKAWRLMPPKQPQKLSAFLGKITRNLSINKYNLLHTQKRGEGQFPIALEELQECIPSGENVEQAVENEELAEIFNRFLEMLPVEKRKVFSLLIYNNYGLTNVSHRSILLNIQLQNTVYYSLGDAYL